MRKTTKIIVGIGGAFSGVGGLRLLIYLDDAKKFLDNLLSSVFQIPKGMVGYYVVATITVGFLCYGLAVFIYGVVLLGAYLRNRGKARAPEIPKVPRAVMGTEKFSEVMDRLLEKERLSYIEARLFYPWYHRWIPFLPKRGIPARRALLDWKRMKACPFDDDNLDLLTEGRIKSNREIAGLRFSVRQWCEAQGFEWTEKLPSRDELYKPTPQNEYIVSLAQEAEEIKIREIHVRLPSGEIMKKEAHFFIVRIGVPLGTENAEDIKLLYRHPKSNEIFQLQKIPSTGVPYIIVQWASPDKFLPNVSEKFATALLDAKEGKIEHLNLTSGESHISLVPLVFFFTVSGSNAVYFPSSYRRAYVMPMKFETELYIEAKGRRQKLLTTLEIDAQRWDYVAVTELSNPTSL